jgi:branched-chain amino acid transport system ATP-binding protein
MLKIDSIFVNYGNFKALHGISLQIQTGEIVALLGSNGAGKTTTINTISGLTTLVSGSILFQGEDISKLSVHERVKRGIIQVPEGRRLFPYMTVQDNLMVGSYLKHTHNNRKQNLDLCYSIFPKLYERKSQMAGSLSGGEQQMCAICRALMQQPKLLMLDEPSLGLAPIIVDSIFDIILDLNKNGMTILLVEQNVMVSLEIAHRGYVIETGENVIGGTSDILRENKDIKKAYMGI